MSDLQAGLGNTGTDYGASDPRPKRSVEFSQVENVYVIRYPGSTKWQVPAQAAIQDLP